MIISDLGDAWLHSVPVATLVGVQVGGLGREAVEGVTEGRDRLAREHAAKPDPGGLDAPVG